MLFEIDGFEPHAEDEWIRRRIRIGEAVVTLRGDVGRCAITTQNPDTGVPDFDTLRTIEAYRGLTAPRRARGTSRSASSARSSKRARAGRRSRRGRPPSLLDATADTIHPHGGCHELRVEENDVNPFAEEGDTATVRVTFDAANGCERLEQRVIRFGPGRSAERKLVGQQEVLYVVAGRGRLHLDGRTPRARAQHGRLSCSRRDVRGREHRPRGPARPLRARA